MDSGRARPVVEASDSHAYDDHWHTAASEEAVESLRRAMSAAAGLFDVTEAAASAILTIVGAKEVSVSLLDGDEHWDVVDVSEDPERGTLYPNLRYSQSDYPIGSQRLLSGRGYVGSRADDPVMVEYSLQVPDDPVGSIMSVPIIALGGVHGEIFFVRGVGTEPFTRDELDLALDCAPLLGARLPALIAAYREDEPNSGPSMSRLTHDLDVLLEDTPVE